METVRCPTCVALLPDPEARRCPLCRTKLRKRRRDRAVVLGESSRLSGRSLPSDVEFHIRAEERFLPDEKRLDEIVHDPANLPHSPPPGAPVDPAPMAPVAAKKSETVDAVLAFAPTQAPEPEIDLTVAAEPEPAPAVDLTAEAEPAIDLTAAAEQEAGRAAETIDEPAAEASMSDSSDSRPKSAWRAVSARNASPLDGTLNEMVGELHRKAREDNWDHRSR